MQRQHACLVCVCITATAFATSSTKAQIPITATSSYTQDFNSIGPEATAQLPDGWRVVFQENGGEILPYSEAGNQTNRRGGNLLRSTAAAGIYNFGSGDSTKAGDRAIGFIFNNNERRAGTLYAKFVNNTGAPLKLAQIGRSQEIYRGGTTNTVVRFYYSFDDTTYIWPGGGSSGSGASLEGFEDTGALSAAARQSSPFTFEPPVQDGQCFYFAYHFFVPIDSRGPLSQALGIDDFYLSPKRNVTELWPSTLEREFPEQTVGTTSEPKRMWLHGEYILGLPPVTTTLTGANPEDFTILSEVSVGTQIRYKFLFTPSAPGARTAKLYFSTSLVTSDTVSLHGEGNIAVPVELTSFVGSFSDKHVDLQWETATETDNFGFDILRSAERQSNSEPAKWQSIGFVEGHGTTTVPHSYEFTDDLSSLPDGISVVKYRLKQIDRDGSISFSKVVSVNLSIPDGPQLQQNYPNPFNPSTLITYQLDREAEVKLMVYNQLGQEVKTLVSERQPPGTYHISWDGRDNVGKSVVSGLYLYRIDIGPYVQTRKMLLVR